MIEFNVMKFSIKNRYKPNYLRTFEGSMKLYGVPGMCGLIFNSLPDVYKPDGGGLKWTYTTSLPPAANYDDETNETTRPTHSNRCNFLHLFW